MADAAQLDRVIAAAWPPAVADEVDGWVLRGAAGLTRRANSALADGCPRSLGDAIAGGENFYRQRGQPPVFLCSEGLTPDSVTQALVDRGYHATATTWVLAADASMLLPQPARAVSSWTMTISVDPSDEWFATYWDETHGARSPAEEGIVREVLLDPPHPRAFVAADSGDGAVAAVGQVVVVEGTGCLQCLVTVPAHRRRGAGRAVVDALLAEARTLGATRMVAAVMAGNAPSLALFEALGFERSHRYAYYVEK